MRQRSFAVAVALFLVVAMLHTGLANVFFQSVIEPLFRWLGWS